MYLNIGRNILLPTRDILGVFELDNTTWSWRTREFLERAQRAGRVAAAGEDLPRAFVLCREGADWRVYLTQLTTAALRGRIEKKNDYET